MSWGLFCLIHVQAISDQGMDEVNVAGMLTFGWAREPIVLC